MKARCCVLGCGPNSSKTTYPFPPVEETALRNEWIKAVGRINWEPALTSRVCSRHFVAEDFHHLKKAIRLKQDAIPSINVGFCDTLKMAKMSGKKCVIPTCSSRFSEAPYFHFPKDKALCLKWLLSIPKGGWSLNQESQVCSRHFEKADVVVNGEQAWLKTGSVPKLYLGSPTILITDIGKTEVEENSETTKETSSDIVAPGTSKGPEESTPSTSKDVDLVDEGNGIYNVKIDPDDGSGSDLEIIEPEIETYEVSDTSDEGEPPPKAAPPVPKEPVVTSLNCKLQINEVRNKTITIKAPGSTTGRVIRGDSTIKCCVPRCGSVAGNPPGVGFHSFPQVGETKLSVRSLDNKLTVHDLFSMWKSLLSVPTISSDSYVCTRHFTANDYTVNVLNKVAVPTQFLPTPVTFAPCKVQEKSAPVQPPPLVLFNKSKNPPPILRKPIRPALTYASPPIRFPGIPSVNNVANLTPVVYNRRGPRASKIFRQIRPSTSQYNLPVTSTLRPIVPVVRAPPPPPPPPVIKKVKLGCSITGCVNKQNKEQSKGVLFRLPHNIEKCKEWVYSCGHPEWLDKGMIPARSMYRICSLHFASEMFLDANHKTLKGSAKPTVNVQEPYKKCVVKHCHNYYDKERLHYIGVDFATFPTEPEMFNSWVKSVKNNTGVPPRTINVTEEDVTNFTGAVICSLHFRNSDYMAGPNGKCLSPKAIPTMNLVFVKEPEVTPSTLTEEPIILKPSAPPKVPDYDDEDMQYVVPKNRRPYFRSRRGRKKGKRPERMNEGSWWIRKDGEGSQPTLGGENSSVLTAEGEQVAEEHNEESQPNDEPRKSPLAPSRRGRGGRRPRGGRRGRRSAKLPTYQEESDEELDQSSRRRSSRIETLYGPSGRPLRTAVLKRKSVVESGSDSQGSNEESEAVKRGRVQRQNSTDSDVSVRVRRSLRPRRAAVSKKFIMNGSDSEEQDKNDDSQQESENCESINYAGGVAEGGHFLDPVLGIKPFQEEPAENISAQPAEQEKVSIDLNVAQQMEEVTMSSDVEEKINEETDETTNQTPNDAAAGECDEVMAPEVSTVDNNMDIVDTNQETSVVNDSKENVSDCVEPATQEGTKGNEMETNHSSDAPKDIEEGKEVKEEMEEGKEVKDFEEEVEEEMEEGKEVKDFEGEEVEELKEEESIDKNPVEPPVPQNSKADDSAHNSSSEGNRLKQLLDVFETVIPYGPKLPFPTQADREFFRSIIPTMATFNQLQKSELRTTIVATLKELLNEELNIEVMHFKTDESVKNDCPVPNIDDV